MANPADCDLCSDDAAFFFVATAWSLLKLWR
jgi:hypothetical protein